MKEKILNIKNRLLKSNYSLKLFRADILSAASVALLTLPQSIAYALIVGLPVYAGVLSAIFGTILTSTFGHSKHLICGPTNATALLLQAGTSSILFTHFHDLPHELRGGVALQIISQVVLFVGVIQILISALKLGTFTQFISRSVMMGYILGVTLSIWISQTFQIFSIPRPVGKFSLASQLPYSLTHLNKINFYSTIVGIVSLILLILLSKIKRKLPRSFLTLVIVGAIVYMLRPILPENAVIPTLSPASFDFKNLVHLHLFYLDWDILKDLLFVALATALLSIFEVNSIARLIAARSGQGVRSNRDILGIGLSNLFSSFFLGVLPSSGSPSRSIFNFNNGAKTRYSGIFIGIFVILLISVFHPLIEYIPIASLSAILIMIGYEIIDFQLLKICIKATKQDALVLVVTALSCCFFQLDIALFIGIALSFILYLRIASQTDISEHTFTSEGHFKPISLDKDRPEKRIRILTMEGNLFFGSIDGMQKQLNTILLDNEVKIIILRFNHVQHLDASICYFLEILANDLRKQGKSLYLCEILHSNMHIVYESPYFKQLGHEYLYEMEDSASIRATEKAFAHALSKLNENENEKTVS